MQLSRRGVLVAAGVALTPSLVSAKGAHPEVTTAAGPVRGRFDNEVAVFKGIPYGASTAGVGRFKPARAPAPWSDVLDCGAYGPAAPQATRALIGSDAMNEDCLRVNVWTPGLFDLETPRPVMVWLHGGGFSSGSGSSPMYDGVALCRRGDAVVVTVNHRLNVFGFLHLADLAGDEWATAGNEGMLDIVLALQWVRANIARFGGDPGNVTIFGESGGGRKVSTLMGMPDAEGLFHRAIIQSGPGVRLQPRDKATEVATAFLAELGVRPKDAAKLQDIEMHRILGAYTKVTARFDPTSRSKGRFEQRGFVPTVGVPALPAFSFDPVASEYSKDVPLLIGSNRHEMALFFRGDPEIYEQTLTEAGLATRVATMVGAGAVSRVLDTYKQAYPDASPAERWVLMVSDRTYRFDSIMLAQRKAALGPATYMYFFSYESRADPKMLAHHALEIPFAFDNLDKSPWSDPSPESRGLAVKMSEAWLAFARDGDPNTNALPEWPRFDPSRRATMVFDTKCRVVDDPDSAVRRLWATI